MLRPLQPLSRHCPRLLHACAATLRLVLTIAVLFSGCRRDRRGSDMPYDNSAMGVALTKIEYPDVEAPSPDLQFPVEAPRTLRDLSGVQYWDLSLEETVRLA